MTEIPIALASYLSISLSLYLSIHLPAFLMSHQVFPQTRNRATYIQLTSHLAPNSHPVRTDTLSSEMPPRATVPRHLPLPHPSQREIGSSPKSSLSRPKPSARACLHGTRQEITQPASLVPLSNSQLREHGIGNIPERCFTFVSRNKKFPSSGMFDIAFFFPLIFFFFCRNPLSLGYALLCSILFHCPSLGDRRNIISGF